MRQLTRDGPARLGRVMAWALPVVAGALAFALAVWSPPDGGPVARAQGGAPQATPPPVYTAIVLEWTTKSEVNTAGFNMYRAESSSGPFAQINRELIPSAGDPIAGGHYVFTDTQAAAGRTYYYQLEDVELGGSRTRHDTITATARGAPATIAGVDATLVLYVFGTVTLVTGLGVLLWRIRR